ncbi:YadA C-terminal domain-containing protein [Salmonella enterica subsp. enterica serovar Saintpaul]|nr:YadA C-terminal domain-containing protein [Salmonella enterica subsp. enterica serovar Saintpaul]
MKKTVLAVIVSMAAASAAHATNTDVNNFFAAVKSHADIHSTQAIYDGLNMRDKEVVDQTYALAGVSPMTMKVVQRGDAGTHAVPAGWNDDMQNKTFATIHPETVPETVAKPTGSEILASNPEAHLNRSKMFLAAASKASSTEEAIRLRDRAKEELALYKSATAPAPALVYAAPLTPEQEEKQQDMKINNATQKAREAQTAAAANKDTIDRNHMSQLKGDAALDGKIAQERSERQAENQYQGAAIIAAKTAADKANAGLVTKAEQADLDKTEAKADAAYKNGFTNSKAIANNTAALGKAIDAQEARDNGQDKAIEDAHATASHAMTNANVALKNTTALGNEAVASATQAQLTDRAVNQEVANRKAADAKIYGAVTSVAGQTVLNAKVSENNTQAISGLKEVAIQQDTQQRLMSAQIENNRATGEYAHARIDAANQNIAANRQALENTNKRVSENSAAIADHETRIGALEQSTTSKFGALKSEVEQNRKRASAGIAGVAAMANIPQVTQGATFSVGAGVGNTDGESALAVGASARINDSWVVKGSVSNDTQHNFVVGAGASYQW